VVSQDWSAAVSGPDVRATTTGIGTRFEAPNGAARFAACWLGALAGRKALLFPWVALASDGNAFGMTTAAAIQTMTTTHLNLTANDPIARKMLSTRTRTE